MRTQLKRAASELAAKLFDAEEARRLETRRDIRRRLAIQEVERKRWQSLDAQCRQVEAEIDQAADEHQAKTSPVQHKLDRLDQQEIDRLASGDQPDTKLAAERLRLVSELTELNTAFENNATAKRRILRKLQEQRAAAANFHSYAADEGQLAREGIASDDLLTQKHILECESRWLQRRIGEARQKVFEFESQVENEFDVRQPGEIERRAFRLSPIEPNGEQIAYLQRHLSRWRAELAQGEKLLSANREASEQNHRAIISE